MSVHVNDRNTEKVIMKKLYRIIAVFALCAMPLLVQAVPITGVVNMSGGAALNGPLGSATGVTSWSNVKVTSVTSGSALDTTINVNDSVAMAAPWMFNSGQLGMWTVGGFTLDLTTSAVEFQSGSFLSVKGLGYLSGNSFDSTYGEWFFSSQGQAADGEFSFSATTVGGNVPDNGTTVAMLGAALLGLVLLRDRLTIV